MDRPWQPILTGRTGRRALGLVESLAAHAVPSEGPHAASLASGAAGRALLLGYLYRTSRKDPHAARALSQLETALQSVTQIPMDPSLFGGFSGVGWVLAHFGRKILSQPEVMAEESMDRAVDQALRVSRGHSAFDLVDGLSGVGVYLLERWPANRHGLQEVVRQLSCLAERREVGVAWRTPVEMLRFEDRPRYPGGLFDLGLAHGVPGVVTFLSQVYQHALCEAELAGLIEQAVRWLLSQRRPDGGSVFPPLVGADVEPRESRLAWCYGDLGVAVALLTAGRCLGVREWEARGLEVAVKAADRSREESGVQDEGLCHGAAGVGHIFNRLYQATGVRALHDSAARWYTEALARTEQALETGEATDSGFLEGSAGVGLALLAAATPIEPSWDRVLLLSLPDGRVGGR